MRYLILLAILVCIGAVGEQLLVHVTITPTPEITAVDTVAGQAPAPPGGNWALTLYDSEDNIVQHTAFEPTYLSSEGPRPLQEVWTSIPKDPRAKRLVLYDDEGRQRDSQLLRSECGDGLCEDHEQGTCSIDCPFAQQAQETGIIQTTPLTSTGTSWRVYGILGAGLLIAILVLLLIHLNRNKDDPVRMQTQENP